MKTREQRRREDVFVLRVWSEASDGVHSAWRASVIHVASREQRYFSNYGDLCEFLEQSRARSLNEPGTE